MEVQELGERIKALRIQKGITQQYVASAVGVRPQAVSKWERGENAPDLFAMPALAALLNTTVDILLGYERKPIQSVTGTLFFSGIAGYTAASEQVAAEDMALSLNVLEAALAAAKSTGRPMSIGLATGSFYMGPVGHPDFARLNVIGDYVNLAARVQSLAGSNTDSGIAAIEETASPWLEKIKAGESQIVEIKGRDNAVALREIFAL